MYVFMHVYICIYVHSYIYTCRSDKKNKYIRGTNQDSIRHTVFQVCVCMYLYVHVCAYVCIYICICICICVSTYPTYQWILTVLGALNVATRHGGSAIVFARPDPSPTDGCGLKLIAVQCQVTCETSDFAKIGDEHTSILKIDIQHCSNA